MMDQITNAAASLPGNIPEDAKKSALPHVLVVDDERLVRWAIAETLSERGYEILEADDAESARRAFLAAPVTPDLALLDLRLPDSADLSLALFMRAQAPAMPILLMTAFGTPDVVAEAASLGIPIVAKPFDVDQLTATIDRMLASRET